VLEEKEFVVKRVGYEKFEEGKARGRGLVRLCLFVLS
jgi:hypothetical protein